MNAGNVIQGHCLHSYYKLKAFKQGGIQQNMKLQSSWCFILRHHTVYGGMKVNWITVTKWQVRRAKNCWASWASARHVSVSIITSSHPGLALLAGAGAAAGHRSEDPEALGLGEPGPRPLALVPPAAVPRHLHLHLGARAGQDLPHLRHRTGLTFIYHEFLLSVPSPG